MKKLLLYRDPCSCVVYRTETGFLLKPCKLHLVRPRKGAKRT